MNIDKIQARILNTFNVNIGDFFKNLGKEFLSYNVVDLSDLQRIRGTMKYILDEITLTYIKSVIDTLTLFNVSLKKEKYYLIVEQNLLTACDEVVYEIANNKKINELYLKADAFTSDNAIHTLLKELPNIVEKNVDDIKLKLRLAVEEHNIKHKSIFKRIKRDRDLYDLIIVILSALAFIISIVSILIQFNKI